MVFPSLMVTTAVIHTLFWTSFTGELISLFFFSKLISVFFLGGGYFLHIFTGYLCCVQHHYFIYFIFVLLLFLNSFELIYLF